MDLREGREGHDMAKRRTNPDFLNGVPELLILKLLSQQPMYGYELVEAIRQSSGEQLQFGEGSVYPILHRLEAEKVLSSRRERTGGRERLVYRVTAAGKRRLSDSQANWKRIANAIELILEGGSDEQLALP